MSDYWMALQIVEESFKENMGAPDQKTEKYLYAILETGKIKPGELAKKFGVAGSSISGWAYKRIQDGILVWCDEAGNEFTDDKVLKTAKHRGMAYLKTSENYDRGNITGLPTPYELTGDPRWNEGGDLLKLYDLQLEKRAAVRSVIGVQNGPNTVPNTSKEDDSIDFIDKSFNSQEGVRVIGRKSGGEENILEEEEAILNSLHEEVDSDGEGSNGGNGKELFSSSDPDALGEEYTFKDPPEPKKRKSRLEQLGIPKPEKRELTEEERRKVDEFAAQFSKFLKPEKSEDLWKGLDSGSSF